MVFSSMTEMETSKKNKFIVLISFAYQLTYIIRDLNMVLYRA